MVLARRAPPLAKLCPGFAELSSRDQVGCYRSLPDCLGRARTTASAGGRRLQGSPQAIGEAALAADLITA